MIANLKSENGVFIQTLKVWKEQMIHFGETYGHILTILRSGVLWRNLMSEKKIALIGGQSNLYKRVKKSIEETWPDWKIKYANDYLMISKHSKKLEIGRQKSND